MTNITENARAEIQLVVFDLASELYGVDIGLVKEIIRMQALRSVPETSSYIEGLINLRGQVISVIDLRKRLAVPLTDVNNDTRIVVVDMGKYDIGFIVDSVEEVLRISLDSVEPPSSAITTADSQYLRGIAKLEDRLIILLDLEQALTLSQVEIYDLPRVTPEELMEMEIVPSTRSAVDTTSAENESDVGEQDSDSGGLKIEMLESSFALVAPRGEELVAVFYDKLFSKHPEAKPFFENSDMGEQKKKLLQALVLVVNNLRKPDVLGPALKQLGQRHSALGVQPEHYPIVGGVLLETLGEFAGGAWTPELKQAWADAYGAVVAGMTG